eukprot:s669_g5.t1
MILRMCWKIVHQFEEVTVFDACESAAPYMFFTFFHSLSMIEIKAMWRVYQLTVLSTHTLFAFLRPSEVGIDTGAKYQVVSLIALSSSMLDSRVSLPFCCLEGLVNVYKAWKYFAGDPARYTSLLLDEVAICGLTCILVVVIKRLAKLHIESRLESGDYSCRLTGFRSVLRGVSDGDILLDANKTLVEDTTSLERLLSTQKKLTGTNLLHLFPGIDERNAFLQFLSASEAQPADWRTPSAFRVTLQGSLGPVSMDLFHVRVVNSSDSKEESFFHLLAIKQDADQMAIPDARDEGLSLNDTERESDAWMKIPKPKRPPSHFSVLELMAPTRKEITLLLTSHSSMWDIGEVHLKYERSNFLDCGMPTLKNFTRPSDWERVIDYKTLEFSGNTSGLQNFLRDLTYVPLEGFIGTDRLQLFVQGLRPQAAAAATEPPRAELGMAIQVQLQEVLAPPATLQMPERLNVFEDSVTDLRINIHDMRPVSPSGIPLASAETANDGSSRPCVRADGPYTWVVESLLAEPCDLFLVVGANGTSMDQLSCTNCTLRPAQLPDQCLTWVTGPVAITAGRLNGGWSLAACENASASSFPSQAFNHSSLPGGNGRFCVQMLDTLGGCFDNLILQVTSQLYYGLPTVTRLAPFGFPLDCSGSVDMMTLPEENLTVDENITNFQLAIQRCAGALSCEYIFDPTGLYDPAPGCIKELEVNYTCPNHQSYSSLARVYPGEVASTTIQCPVKFLPSPDPLALHGSLQQGGFLLLNSIDIFRLRQLTSCPNAWRPGVNVTQPVAAFEALVSGASSSEFCIIGAPAALDQFAQHLRYVSRADWAGSEPMRITLTAAEDQEVIVGAEQTWIVVETTNDRPSIVATQGSFEVRTGESVVITGINISDADMSDGTRWMTLLVAASIGRLYVEPSFLLSPLGTLEPIQGRLDGDFALRLRGSGPDLQGFVEALRFRVEAPVKPSLTTRPLNQSETEAIISYILSDTITQQAGALRNHQVAGKVVDPESDEPVEGVEVVIIARDTWHDYQGYTLDTGCGLELVGWSVADCKSYAENNSYISFTHGLSTAGGAQSCCFKSEDVELILMNLVSEASENLYIFQPGGYFVRETTSAAGMFAAIMPTGPADIYFTKALYATRNLSIVVNDNIQVGGSADIYLQALAVVTIWRFEVDWISNTGSPVDLDAHAFDAWDCHVYFANRICQHDGSHGLTVTLNRAITNGPTGVSTSKADSHVPIFDNTAKNYREYRRRCEVYRQKMELAGRGKETVFNLVTLMTGRSWDLVEDLDVEQLSNDGYTKVFARLDKGFQFDPLTELPGDFEKFFMSLNRKQGQTLQDYTQEFAHAERRLRTIHKVDLPEKVRAWFFLRRSGLTKEQRLMVLSSVGHQQLDLENVQKTMNFVIGQDTKLEGSRWNRTKDPVMYNDETYASSPWPEDDQWDYATEAAYYEDDYDGQWPDYDANYFDENDTTHADEQETDCFDVEEYDTIYANFVEAVESPSRRAKASRKGSQKDEALHRQKEEPKPEEKLSSEVDDKFVSDVELQGIKPGTAHHRAIANARSRMQVTM